MFIVALFIKAKIQKQPKSPSMNEWIKKLWYIKIEYYSAIKQKEILPFVTMWMDFSRPLSEIIQTEKDKYDMIYTWNLQQQQQQNPTSSQIHRTDWWLPEGAGVGAEECAEMRNG